MTVHVRESRQDGGVDFILAKSPSPKLNKQRSNDRSERIAVCIRVPPDCFACIAEHVHSMAAV
jgi:hypothetical protein